MITWLASYPRSGSALLRTILKTCFGPTSYDQDYDGMTFSPQACERIAIVISGQHGRIFIERRGDRMTISSSRHIILQLMSRAGNLHNPGRQVKLLQLLRYQESFFPEAHRGLLQIIPGDDFYRDWSSHFRSWNQASRPLLLLKYEDLVGIGRHCSQENQRVSFFATYM